jgi:hypothetical protein
MVKLQYYCGAHYAIENTDIFNLFDFSSLYVYYFIKMRGKNGQQTKIRQNKNKA